MDKAILNIVRLENRLHTSCQCVLINFNYRNEIIGELRLKLGQEHACIQPNQFLTELADAGTVEHFNHLLLIKFN